MSEPETTSAPDSAPPTFVSDGATLPPGEPASAPAPEPECAPDKVGGLAKDCSPSVDTLWLAQRRIREELLELAAETLKLAMKGELPHGGEHSKLRVDAAVAVLCRAY